MSDEGTLLGGRYELGAMLGRGGMAQVRRARDMRLSRNVAVKQLRLDLAGDPTFQARFRREAQSAAGLNHPNIVAVYDTGEQADPATGVEVPYIVMELVVGHTLRDILRDGRKILPERALEMTQQVLDALQYSHNAGIIHRDIKPANVMLTAAGQVKVMDFGIARAVADTAASMTQTAAVIGTAQYLSPEQARGEQVDNRSDIYSAGCLLYELLTGQPPFTGDSPISVAFQHVRELPKPPSQVDPVITPAMDAIVLKSLAKDPADRYQTAREMRDDIGRLLAGQAVTAVIPAAVPEPVEARTVALTPVASPVSAMPLSPASPVPVAMAEEPRRRSTGVIVGLAVALVAALIAGYLLFWNKPAPTVQQVAVPAVKTMTVSAATAALDEQRLKAQVTNVEGPDDQTVGTVTAQNPEKGTLVDPGSAVALTVNIGPAKGTIPAGLKGKNKDDVVKQLQALGFTKVSAVEAQNEAPTAAANSVTDLQPAEGATISKAAPITVTFATGKSKVPNLANYSKDTAIQKAADAGFTKIKIVEQTSTVSPGTVLSTNPGPDTLLDRSAELTVTVAKATPSPVPTVTVTTTPTPPPATTTASSTTTPTPSASKS